MVAAGIKNVYCAHYHRKSWGMYKDLKVMVTGALGTSILTKDIPDEIKGNEVKEASFKVSGKAFGGLAAEEDVSGLYVVKVGEGEVSEDWMSIADMQRMMPVAAQQTAIQKVQPLAIEQPAAADEVLRKEITESTVQPTKSMKGPPAENNPVERGEPVEVN